MLKIIILFVCILLSFLNHAEKINVYLNDEPFLSYYVQEKEKNVGFGIEVINLLLSEMGDTPELNIMPLARIIQRHKTDKNSLFISLYKQESDFKDTHYVGSISQFPINIYKLKARKDIVITSINDLQNYSFGVVRNGGRHSYFHSINFINSYKNHIVTSDKQNILRFFYGRTDLLIENPLVLKYFAETEEFNLSLIEKLMTIDELSGDIGIFFSESTVISLVKKYQKALSNIKKTDEYKSLLERYGASL